MRLKASLKNALKVAKRLRSVNGIIMTPEAAHDAVKIKRAWLFGSTVKGCPTPADTDILLELEVIGATKEMGERGCQLDKRQARRHGNFRAKNSQQVAFRYLSRGMRQLSLHDFKEDADIATPRRLIYPKLEAF